MRNASSPSFFLASITLGEIFLEIHEVALSWHQSKNKKNIINK